MRSIGIVGAGTAGLHLGLKLLQGGVPVTLYAEQEPSTLGAGRLPNTVAHHPPTLARERELGVDHWDAPAQGTHHLSVHVNGPQPFSLSGRMTSPSLFVDYRLYHARLLEDFTRRGGRLHVGAVDVAGLERLSREHDLTAVATGRNGLTSLFPRVEERSPHTRPPRLLFAALVRGMRMPEPRSMQAHLVPGQGEIFESQIHTRHGLVPSLLIEAAPEGELAVLSTQRHDADPRAFEALLLDRLRRFAPATFERVDPKHFGVLGPTDWLQGAVTPVVRQGWATLANGRPVLAVGDTHVTNDPVAGQGANAASGSAFAVAGVIADALRDDRPFDEAFCRDAEARAWAATTSTTAWTNMLLQPPPPHVIEVLLAAARDPRIADAFATAFMIADEALAAFGSPEGSAAFIARHRSPATARA